MGIIAAWPARVVVAGCLVASCAGHVSTAVGWEPGAAASDTASDQAQTELPQGKSRAWKYIVLHHSATDSGSVDSIDAEHRQRLDSAGRPWLGIGYHFVIGNGQGMPDGQVQSTFRWREQREGAHAGLEEFNQHGIGICLVGNFDQSGPTQAQLAATRQLVDRLQRQFGLSNEQLLRHGDLKATACPGKYFSMDLIARVVPVREDAGNRESFSRSTPALPDRMEEDDHVAAISPKQTSAADHRAER